ncbi:MAG: valine--tRNA ligase [Pseudomonadota bacterium]
MLEKNYNAAESEPRIAQRWDDSGAFKAGAGALENSGSYCIVIPPPNVTGSLHMGHALNNTLQDILIRFERMRGKDVLWQPGMDHAGIATQMVVERQLMERQQHRRSLGRDKFIEKVWEWKEESGGAIVNQLRRLGASCDWSRERFTMDEGLSRAVIEVFVTLYDQGLIYKAKRLVNWDPKLHTAISDLEVEQVDTKGNLWYFRYPLEAGASYEHPVAFDPDGNPTEWETRNYLVVATTRPETMLGDTGVAVHPDDKRYADLVGKHIVLPLVGRRIKIVADDYANPEEGTGAVKITPAHDFNDFDVGNRTGLSAINIMTRDGHIALKENEEFLADLPESDALAETLEAYDKEERFAVRKKIVARMESLGLLDRVEDHQHMVPHGDRSAVPIEPYLTDQWYVDAETLAGPAIASVREGRTVFVPKNWEKTYFEWMENIQPWCISRQLWWGHQIPAWYGPDGRIFVERSEADAIKSAEKHYGAPAELTRDEDVLDTWFSSGLWPFSTLGWPEHTPELDRYYQTDVLVTGFDIIFFWVARMMMMGLHFMKDDSDKPIEPFHTVYVHALVRDKFGAKMSKSKGNVIDPLELIDEYGADALRFTLAIMAAQGRDVKLDPQRVAGYRNFGTKIWNAARFAEMNGVALSDDFNPLGVHLTINRWILTELARTVHEVTAAIESFRFNEASGAAYRFVWNTFCDWYLELMKPVFDGEDEAAKREVQSCAAHVLDEIYKLLHPFMPFITEELWDRTPRRKGLLCHAQWPTPGYKDEEAALEINWLIELVTGLRSARSEMNVPPKAVSPLVVVGANDETCIRLLRHDPAIKRLGRVDDVVLEQEVPKGSAQIVVGEATYCLPLGALIDVSAEKERLEKALGKASAEYEKIEKKLQNDKFVANAKPEIVETERTRLSDLKGQREKIRAALERVEEAI